MENAVARNRRLMLAQNIDVLDINEDLLRTTVLQSLINRKLLSQVTESLDLRFSDARLDDEIVATPAFQIQGAFNSQQFQLVVGSAGFTPVSYRDEMRLDKVFGQLSSAIGNTAFVTGAMTLRAGSVAQQTRDIAFLRIDLESLLPEVEVFEEEMVLYYDTNSASYETPETVDIGFLELKVEDLMDEVDFAEEELQAYFEENRALYGKLESRRVAHILVEIDDGDEQAASDRAGELYQQILGGEDFAELAKEHSSDLGSASNGGELGFSQRGDFVAEFEQVAFTLETNQVAEPVRSEYGFHIIKVLEIDAGLEPDLAEVREAVERAYREQLAEDVFVSRSARLGELAFESVGLDEPAAVLGLELKSTGHMSRVATAGIAATPAVLETAFSEDLLTDGNNSDIIEVDSNHHIVIRVDSYEPKKLREFVEVDDEIRETLTRDKAADLAETRGLEIVARLASGSLTRVVADEYGLEWQVVSEASRDATDLDSGIRDKAFSLSRPQPDGKSTDYTILPNGDVVVVTATNVANRAESQISSAEVAGLARVMASQLGMADFQEYQDSLVTNADVEKIQ